jgi:hypothetical protein
MRRAVSVSLDQETGIGVPQGVKLAVAEPGPAQDRCPVAAAAAFAIAKLIA